MCATTGQATQMRAAHPSRLMSSTGSSPVLIHHSSQIPPLFPIQELEVSVENSQATKGCLGKVLK